MSSQIRLTSILIACCIALVLSALIHPFWRGGQRDYRFSCLANAKQLAIGQLMYSYDYDDHLPPSEKWMDTVLPYCNKNDYYCPTIKDRRPDQFGYAFYFKWSGRQLTTFDPPEHAILLFESVVLDKNAATGLVGFGKRHTSVPFGFADGHCKVYADGTRAEMDKTISANIAAK